jgi:hypothetical protein
MQEYKVIGQTVKLPGGFVVKLTSDQYRRRQHAVKNIGSTKKPEYEVKDSIEFKKGETFTVLQGDIGYKARKADIAWLNQPEQEPEEEPED